MSDKQKCQLPGCRIPDDENHTHPTNDSHIAMLSKPLNIVRGAHVILDEAKVVTGQAQTTSFLEAVAMQNLQDAAGQQSPEIHKAMVDALTQRFVDDEAEDFDSLKSQFDGIKSQVQMVPGRKLTEALLEAGMPPRDYREYLNDRVKSKEEPSQSLIRLIGSIAWRILAVMVVVGVIVAVLAGGRV